MLNVVWIFLILLGMVFAIFKGTPEIIISSLFEGGRKGIMFAIELSAILALWTGILKIAEKSGLVAIMARTLGPFFNRIFPEVPRNHQAHKYILTNMGANILGLGNIATPSGIMAMQELQKISKNSIVASNSMIRLLVFNTSIFQLVPGTILALRAEAGSTNPSEIIFPIWISSIISFIVSIFVLRAIERRGKKHIW